MRMFKLCNDYAEPISFRVPRTRMEFFQDDIYSETRKLDTPSETGSEWLSGVSKDPVMISLRPQDMKKLSEAPTEKKVQKYVFEEQKQDDEFNKDKMMNVYWDKMGTQKEKQAAPLKQDLMQGATHEEWN